jgi:hypothetical protein
MALTLSQRRQLQAALLAAFSLDELRRLVRFVLDVDLEAISAGDLEQRVFEVVDYAEQRGRVADLVAGAVRQNPGNEQMQALIVGALGTTYEQKKTSAEQNLVDAA